MVSEADEVTTASRQIDELPIDAFHDPGSGVCRAASATTRRYSARPCASPSPADAEASCRPSFCASWPGCGIEEVALPAAYFRRAAVNAAVDVLRRRELRAESIYDHQAPHAAVQPPGLLKERLRRALGILDSEDASLFLLRHVEGLSIEELAGLFQIERNNVAVRLHRIRLRLQAEMER